MEFIRWLEMKLLLFIDAFFEGCCGLFGVHCYTL